MSPFQQDVIDTTLAEFDRQAAKGLPALSAQAIQLELLVVVEKVYKEQSFKQQARNRAALQAQLIRSRIYTSTKFSCTSFWKKFSSKLAQQTPALLGQQIASLTTLGGQQQARQQQLLTADQQLAQRQAFQPLEAAQQFGSGITL